MNKLPNEHKAKWFSGAALNSAEAAMMSVLSTILSRLNAFLDTEMEQILCFNTEIDAETFCNNKSAVFIILPEEDSTKYFMVSLFLQQFYREMLQVADENGGVLPNSQTAEFLSKAMGSRTVMSGSVSRGKNDPSQSLQMIERALMTPDELKSIPKGNFIVMKTGTHPMKSKLKLFLDWGITFEKPYITEEKSHRTVHYADKVTLEKNIIGDRTAIKLDNPPPDEEYDTHDETAKGGIAHAVPNQKSKKENISFNGKMEIKN